MNVGLPCICWRVIRLPEV